MPSYSATYGSMGAVVVLMLWLHLVSLAILVGGEINDEIEKSKDQEGYTRRRTGNVAPATNDGEQRQALEGQLRPNPR